MTKPDGFGIDWLGRRMTWRQVESNIASGVYGANARQIELFVKDNKGFGTSDVLNENELAILKSLSSGVAPEVPTIQGSSIFVKKYQQQNELGDVRFELEQPDGTKLTEYDAGVWGRTFAISSDDGVTDVLQDHAFCSEITGSGRTVGVELPNGDFVKYVDNNKVSEEADGVFDYRALFKKGDDEGYYHQERKPDGSYEDGIYIRYDET